MKFYDVRKIAAGIVVFVVLITFSFWYGKEKIFPPPAPDLNTPAIAQMKEKLCVEDTSFMRTNHMKLLNAWRDSVAREGNRLYTAKNGSVYQMSLSGTCLQCHSNKEQFCDRCHNSVAAKPTCFSCHIIPEVKK
jgi:hypothetical protein